MWYFGSHGEFVDRERQLPTPGPGGLASYDPAGFRLLSSIYGGTHPLLTEEDAVGTRLHPLDVSDQESGKSVDEPEVEASLVSMEFDNRGCDCAWKLYWLDASGERRQYGEVPRDAVHMQATFPGHVWHLEKAGDDGATATADLRYAAVPGPAACVADVREDAKCQRAGGVV